VYCKLGLEYMWVTIPVTRTTQRTVNYCYCNIA